MKPSRRRAWLTVVLAMLAAVCAGVLAPAAMASLTTGGSVATGIEAVHAQRRAERLGVPSPDLFLALSRAGAHPAQPPLEDGVVAVAAALAGDREVAGVWAPTVRDNAWLLSRDGETMLVAARLKGVDGQPPPDVSRLVKAARTAAGGLRVEASGPAAANEEIDETSARDLMRAELITAPVLFLLLIFAYGSLVAALLPVLVAVLAVGCTIPVLGLLAQVTEVSWAAVNAASAIGAGLAVDYSLFLLARVREQRARGDSAQQALSTALHSTRRSIVFSAAAITACLAAALVVPVPVLRALSMAGMIVSILSAAVALLVLPALLRLLGPHTYAFDPLSRWRRTHHENGSKFWRSTARTVTTRPLLTTALAAVLLGVITLPLGHARLGLADERTLPPSAPAAAAAQHVRDTFAAPPERLLTLVVTGPDTAQGLPAYTERLARVPHIIGVRIVRPAQPANGPSHTDRPSLAAVLLLASAADPGTEQAAAVVRAVRATTAPGAVLVGGRAAEVTDTITAIRNTMPLCFLLLACALLTLLAAYTRTIIAPLKALLVAMASLGASLAILVVLFQDGHGRTLLGNFTVTGTLDTPMLLFTLLVALALSIDYEIFLLGRIREEYDRTGSNRTAIIDGIARTGRLVSSAAAALALSAAAMGTSDVSLLKFTGVGIAICALVDAVLVRGILVPAVMAALGPANWWTPAPWRKPVTAS
ncbi:MMPL family transporter [Streptomyces sp. NBC_01546]|uniref:MMPL family transporter n=1 Tax=Streptomyces sp. NBC_01546 TaxID=2975872 RepID=UPI00386E66B0